MSHDPQVLSDPDFFASLAGRLPAADKAVFGTTNHGRVETASPGRELVVYRMQGRRPLKLAQLSIVDLWIDDEGASTEIVDLGTRARLVVGYSPTRLFDYPIFMSLPPSLTMRWRVACEDGKPFMTWPIYMRTQSRRHLREVGVTYCETLRAFREEFPDVAG